MADWQVNYKTSDGKYGNLTVWARLAKIAEEEAKKKIPAGSTIISSPLRLERADSGNDKWMEDRLSRLEDDEARLQDRAPDADREEVRRIYQEMRDISREKEHLGRAVERTAESAEDKDLRERGEAAREAEGRKDSGAREEAARQEREFEELKRTDPDKAKREEEFWAGRKRMAERAGVSKARGDSSLDACADSLDKIVRRLDTVERDCRS